MERKTVVRVAWHWAVAAISVLAIIALLLLLVGEYRFENQHLPR
jgi:hypothetical protein